MVVRKPKPIVCKCGKLLGTTSNTRDGGTKVCPSCKRRIRYDVTPEKVYVSYE